MERKEEKEVLPEEFVKVSKVVELMDSVFKIPGTNKTFGIDPILNLIPYGGAIVGFLLSSYIVLAMVKNGASSKVIGKMIGNITVDAMVGAIPILGMFFDFVFKANKRNLALAIEYFEEGKHRGSVLPYLLAMAFVLLVMVVLFVYFAVVLLKFLLGFLSSI